MRSAASPTSLPRSASWPSMSISPSLRAEEGVVEAELPLEHRRRARPRRGRRAGSRGARRARPRRGASASSASPRRGRRRDRPRTTRRSRARSSSSSASRPCEARDRRDAAEDPADRGRVEAARVEGARGGHADAAHDLVSGDDRGERVARRDAPSRSARRERRRGDDRRDMADRVGVRVVEVEPVAEHRVRECGVRGGQARVACRSRSPAARRRARPSSPCPRRRRPARVPRARSRSCRGRGAWRPRAPPGGTSSSSRRRRPVGDRPRGGHRDRPVLVGRGEAVARDLGAPRR